MGEEDDVVIKHIETKKIPVDSIKLSELQARLKDVTVGLDVFAEQIRPYGLIQPIVVYKEGEEYELLVGQRRYYAHKDVLKWSKILAMIIEKPSDDDMSRTISWLENVARKQMSNTDKLRHVTNMLGKGATQDEVARVLSISKAEVKRAVKLPSCPEVVQVACEKGEISIKNAIRATNAKNYEKGHSDESMGEDVLDLAKKMESMGDQAPSNTETQNMSDYSYDNPEADNEELLEEGVKSTEEVIKINFSNSEGRRLASYQKKNSLTSKGAAARDLVLDGLDRVGD